MLDLDRNALASLLDLHDEDAVRKAALDTDYVATDLVTAAFRVARVLLYRSPAPQERDARFPNVTDTAYERWIEKMALQKPYWGTVLVNWIRAVPGFHTTYPIFLYNRNFGASRRVYERFLTAESPPPPYLSLLYLNLFRQAIGLSHGEISARMRGDGHAMAPLFHELFSTDVIERWLVRKNLKLRYYGGETNTLLGYYDAFFRDPAAGLALFNRAAQGRYDLGGGFNTSEVERLLGCPFVSADLVTPRCEDYDSDLVIQALLPNGERIVADDATRSAFLEKQQQVRHLPFNVLEDSFPEDFQSYAIVSTGFMTSTVRPSSRSEQLKRSGEGLHNLSLSLHAIMRVVELAAKRKDVDLFTVQRASHRVYKYKTCLLQWRQGRLVQLITTDDPDRIRYSEDRLALIYEDISPTNRRYAALLAATLQSA